MWKYMVGIAFLIVAFAASYPWFLKNEFTKRWGMDLAQMGPVGDYIGGTTAPLLNFAGFLIFFATLLLQNKLFTVQQRELATQQKTLQAQREEIKLTRDELALTRSVFDKQSVTMSMERFENTLFNLISLHNEIAGSLVYNENYNPVPITGRAVINRFDAYLKRDLKLAVGEELIVEVHDLYDRFEDVLGHYFRNGYNILSYIYHECNDERLKRNFISVFLGQITNSEYRALMYHCLTSNDSLDLFRALTEMRLLNLGELINEDHATFFISTQD